MRVSSRKALRVLKFDCTSTLKSFEVILDEQVIHVQSSLSSLYFKEAHVLSISKLPRYNEWRAHFGHLKEFISPCGKYAFVSATRRAASYALEFVLWAAGSVKGYHGVLSIKFVACS